MVIDCLRHNALLTGYSIHYEAIVRQTILIIEYHSNFAINSCIHYLTATFGIDGNVFVSRHKSDHPQANFQWISSVLLGQNLPIIPKKLYKWIGLL
ncbi:hypothetical protein BpHYR1_032881 [Brachionus plicatilis]|uniref:Uncharacterized protein n=1 Tax=Brachionus plicatilis TaxID=10195 RepID=A0A3M7QEM4_BRAPC|nr:hypothetical protein BpHYR1_032881 [Brachionus plicatilis]